MHRYSVIFSNGIVQTRTSNRVYTHAWRAVWIENGKSLDVVGFSGSASAAQRAANRYKYAAQQAQSELKTEIVDLTSSS